MKRKIAKVISFKLKVIKYLLIIIFSFSILLGGAFSFLVYLYPRENLKQLIISASEKSLERKVRIEKIDYGLRGLEFDKVVILDNLGKDFIKADKVILAWSLNYLLQGDLVFDQVIFKRLNLDLLFNKDGVSNLEVFLDKIKNKEKKEDSFLKIKITKFKFQATEINLPNPFKEWSPLKGRYFFEGSLSLVSEEKFLLYDCQIILPEKRGRIFPFLSLDFSSEADFLGQGQVELDKVDLLWTYQWADKTTKLPYKVVSGKISQIKFNKEMIEGFFEGSGELINYPKLLKAQGLAKVSFKDKKISLFNTVGSLSKKSLFQKIDQRSSVNIKELVFNTNGDMFSFDFKDIDVTVGDLKVLLYFIPFYKYYGQLKGTLSFSQGKYNGILEFVNCGYDFTKKVVSEINGALKIKDNLFKNENIKVKICNYPCLLSVAATSKKLKDYFFSKLFVNLKADKYFYDSRQNKDRQELEIFNSSTAIVGQVQIDKFGFDDLKLSAVSFNYELYENRLIINHFKAKGLSGAFNGEALISTSQKPHKVFTNLNFQGIKMQDLSIWHPKIEDRFFGKASGKADLNFLLKNNFQDSLQGKMNFNIKNGKLVDTGIQNGLGFWLKELKYKLKDLEFNDIHGDVIIKKNKNYFFSPFIFVADDINLQMEGDINGQSVTKNMDVKFKFNKNFIKEAMLTSAFSYFIRKNLYEGWYVFLFKIKGDITNSQNYQRLN